MRSMCSGIAVLLCVLIAVPCSYAQTPPSSERPAPQVEHVAPQALLDAAVEQQVSTTDRDRETLRLFLERDDVKSIAGKAGIDIARAQTAVAAIDASELGPLAAQARQAEQGLAGGASTVVISTTTILIALLVLILLIVALK